MSNYIESKKKLDAIRNKYSSAGDVIFRAAIDMLIDLGKVNCCGELSYDGLLSGVDNELDRTVLKCAHEIADINTTDLLIYIQKELYFGNEGGMSYQTMTRRLKDCVYWIAEDVNSSDAISDLTIGIGFSECELKELGYEYLFDFRGKENQKV